MNDGLVWKLGSANSINPTEPHGDPVVPGNTEPHPPLQVRQLSTQYGLPFITK